MTVEAATDHRTLRAAQVALVAAFEDDPLLARIFPRERDRAALLRSAVRATLRLATRRGRIDIDRRPDGEVAGVAVWFREDALRSVAALAWLVRLGAEAGVRRPAVVPHLLLHQLRLRAIHRRLGPHHYLALLGIRPDHRRGGIGLRLLKAGLEGGDGEALPAVLDASLASNAEWYERRGFGVVEVVQWRFGTTWVMRSRAEHAAR